jgi:hypothetical protein
LIVVARPADDDHHVTQLLKHDNGAAQTAETKSLAQSINVTGLHFLGEMSQLCDKSFATRKPMESRPLEAGANYAFDVISCHVMVASSWNTATRCLIDKVSC